jgi:excisionase family DNA binding protein
MEERMYTPKEIAEKLKTSEQTIRRYLRNGIMEGVPLEKGWRVKQSQLDAFMNRRRPQAS